MTSVRTRRRLALAGVGALVLVGAVVVAVTVSRSDDDERVRGGAPTSTTSAEPTKGVDDGAPGPAPASPSEATVVVETFLATLRDEGPAAAAPSWSGYPEVLADPSTDADGVGPDDERVALLEAFRAEFAWLVDAPAPTFTVVASAGSTPLRVVTAVVPGVGGAPSQAAAFVVGAERGGRIERLPSTPRATDPSAGDAVQVGDALALPAMPVEGGVRVFVDELEVPTTVDLGAGVVTFEVPSSGAGLEPADGLTITVSEATPELPAAYAVWFAAGP